MKYFYFLYNSSYVVHEYSKILTNNNLLKKCLSYAVQLVDYDNTNLSGKHGYVLTPCQLSQHNILDLGTLAHKRTLQ